MKASYGVSFVSLRSNVYLTLFIATSSAISYYNVFDILIVDKAALFSMNIQMQSRDQGVIIISVLLGEHPLLQHNGLCYKEFRLYYNQVISQHHFEIMRFQ